MTDHHYDLIKKTIRIFLIVFFMWPYKTMTDHHYDLIKKTIRIFLIVFFMCFLLFLCDRSFIR